MTPVQRKVIDRTADVEWLAGSSDWAAAAADAATRVEVSMETTNTRWRRVTSLMTYSKGAGVFVAHLIQHLAVFAN